MERVEWSRSRQAWCIQDAAGHCLTHVEHIVGQDQDVQTAIKLARRMILDGRMPSPEEAHRPKKKRPKKRVEPEYLGEPWVLLQDRAVIGVRRRLKKED